MNSDNYRARRTRLLFDVGLHQCLHCGHPGSRGNGLEFHHVNGKSLRHGIGGRQNLVILEQEWWEWQRFHRPEHALIVLCHKCHVKVHSNEEVQEARKDAEPFQEMSRYRFCANQSRQCIHKRCVECHDYRLNLSPKKP